jgi:hypothetical protein
MNSRLDINVELSWLRLLKVKPESIICYVKLRIFTAKGHTERFNTNPIEAEDRKK